MRRACCGGAAVVRSSAKGGHVKAICRSCFWHLTVVEGGFAARRLGAALGMTTFVLASLLTTETAAYTISPDSSYVQVTFACRFTGSYRTGEPLDVVTVSPNGNGDTFAQSGISIRVFLRDDEGRPVVGVPAESITLTHPALCVCPGGNVADAPTDASGSTSFSGALRAGGCAPNLMLQVDGVDICPVPVMTNSPDFTYGDPCSVAADELALFANLITGNAYTLCRDLNVDGVINAVDWAILANRHYGHSCLGRTGSADGLVSDTVAAARPRVGMFFDPEARTCNKEIGLHEYGTIWIIASFDEQATPVVGTEFGIYGLPNWFYYLRGPSGFQHLLGDGGELVIVGYAQPLSGPGNTITLVQIEYFSFSEVPTTTLRLEGRLESDYDTPILIRREVSSGCGDESGFQFSVMSATGSIAVINGPCSVAAESTSWGRIKSLYR